MLNIDNLTDFSINISLIENIIKKHTPREIELIVCYNVTIQEYNQAYRGRDVPTDVLSFPIENDMIRNGNILPLGSIIISIDFVRDRAKEFHHSDSDEFTLLFIHGLLHLLGYDHEVDSGEMRKKEEEIIKELNLPDSLIVRAEGG